MGRDAQGTTAVVLDLDGTLVDSVPFHVVTWHEALLAHDLVVPSHRIHSGIGMGSDRLVRHLLGRLPSADLQESLEDHHRRGFLDLADRLRPTAGALVLLEDLADREVPFVVATSAGGAEREALLSTLDDPDVPVTDAGDVDTTKPAPQPLHAAIEDLPDDRVHPIMVGDSPWDGRAAARAGIGFVAVRCGGFADEDLRSAGASRVVEDPRALIGTL